MNKVLPIIMGAAVGGAWLAGGPAPASADAISDFYKQTRVW